jgi:hypothetical protein
VILLKVPPLAVIPPEVLTEKLPNLAEPSLWIYHPAPPVQSILPLLFIVVFPPVNLVPSIVHPPMVPLLLAYKVLNVASPSFEIDHALSPLPPDILPSLFKVIFPAVKLLEFIFHPAIFPPPA